MNEDQRRRVIAAEASRRAEAARVKTGYRPPVPEHEGVRVERRFDESGYPSPPDRSSLRERIGWLLRG